MSQEVIIDLGQIYNIIGIGFEVPDSFRWSQRIAFSVINENQQENCTHFIGEINVAQKIQLMFPCSTELIAKYVHIRSNDSNINICNVNVLVRSTHNRKGKFD